MNEKLIFFKIWAMLKMYVDWNCIYQDWKKSMNETLILYKISAMLKKYWDWICIYEDWNNHWKKH